MHPAKTVAVACMALAFVIPDPAAATSADDAFDAGIEAYQRCQYADALTALTFSAHMGHRRAQEVAGFMNLLGSSLYGSGVGTDRSAALRWFQRAAMQGSEVGAKLAGIDTAKRSVESAPGEGVEPDERLVRSR